MSGEALPHHPGRPDPALPVYPHIPGEVSWSYRVLEKQEFPAVWRYPPVCAHYRNSRRLMCHFRRIFNCILKRKNPGRFQGPFSWQLQNFLQQFGNTEPACDKLWSRGERIAASTCTQLCDLVASKLLCSPIVPQRTRALPASEEGSGTKHFCYKNK